MNGAHLHLILNHVPVIGSIGCLLLLGIARARNSEELTRIGLWLLVLVAAFGIVVYLTGEAAEEIVEDLAGISKDLIEEHEEMALLATIVLGLVGAGALGLLFRFRNAELPGWTGTAAFLLAFVPAALMAATANRGGRIHHPEIRGETSVVESEDGAALPWRPDSGSAALEHAVRKGVSARARS
ncbi:MAG: hypothetical protein ACE5HF_09610 [Gemmatimonadota bacterium]